MQPAYKQNIDEFIDSVGNALVIGLGKSGLACASYLFEEGWEVEVADTRDSPPLEEALHRELPGIPLHKGPIKPRLFLHTDLAVVGPGVAKNGEVARIAKKYGARVVSYLDLFMEKCSGSVIAISGTNGKSTVATLVCQIIRSNGGSVRKGGSGGTTTLELLTGSEPDVYILELSPGQLEQSSSMNANVAVALNIAPNILDSQRSNEEYSDMLLQVYRGAKYPVINRNDFACRKARIRGKAISFGLDTPPGELDYGIIEVKGVRWFAKGSQKILPVNKCILQGGHNELNILAAMALADSAGYSVSAATKEIAKFEGLPYCCNNVGSWDGVRWINDAKSTNVDAAIAAIRSSGESVVLIAGGINKGTDFSKLTKAVNGKLRGCVVFGRDRKQIGKSVQKAVDTRYVDDIYGAVSVAAEMAQNGDGVVFSPACVSYDMFIDFRQRGEHFNQAVKEFYNE